MTTSRKRLLWVAMAVALMCFGVLVSGRTAIAQEERPPRGRTERIDTARSEGREAEPGTEQAQRAERVRELERRALDEIRQRRPEMLPRLKELKRRDERAYRAALRDIAARARQAGVGQRAQRGQTSGVRGMVPRIPREQLGRGAGLPRSMGRLAAPEREGFRSGQVAPVGPAGRMGQRPAPGAGLRGAYRRQPAWGVGREQLGARRGPGPSLQRPGGPAAARPGLRQGAEWRRGPDSWQFPARAFQGGYRQLPQQGFRGWDRGPAGRFQMAPENDFRGGGRWFAPRPGF